MAGLYYPLDSAYILKKRKSIKRELLADGTKRIKKRIAVLGGSTTSDIISVLELFLLDRGIEPEFYESEYARYWQDAMFENPELDEFSPEIIFIHTSWRNITFRPTTGMSDDEIKSGFDSEYEHFESMWKTLEEKYHAVIIQNNFEMPLFRLLGNKDASDPHGFLNLISRLNLKFYDYAASHKDFYINDINYISASYGLDKWSEPKWWYMYKYCLCLDAIPEFCLNLSNIIKSVLGKNKKAFALDLDNTLWGGVVGDDGVDGIVIGQETAEAEGYFEFQEYLKAHKDLGVILTVASKNDEENAIAGLNHPDGALKPDDFVSIKANWDPKDKNIADCALEIGLTPDSFVFVDDNPAERHIVSAQLGVIAPEIGRVDEYIKTIDKNGFFEVTAFSADDLSRNQMYKANAERAKLQKSFESYTDYLLSLEMEGDIGDFEAVDIARVTQLTNKSNQFNLTTRRFTPPEMEEVAKSDEYIRLRGRLKDKFGDNGIVSVVIGKINGEALDIILWLMSCRVLKRDMEYAMLDALVDKARARGIKRLVGHYYPTAKNKMVKDLYLDFGFEKISEDSDGNTDWELSVEGYENKNSVIAINS